MPDKKYFVIPEPAPDSSFLHLAGDEAHHLSRVSRVKPGEQVTLLDGVGGVYEAIVKKTAGIETELEIVAYTQVRKPPPVDMAIALTRAPRFDIAVEKCCELGLRELVPVETRDLWALETYECHVAVPAGCVAMVCLDAAEQA